MRLPRTSRWAALISLLFLILTGLAAWRAPEIAAWRWYLQEGKPKLISAKLVLLPPLRWLDDYYVVADLGKNTFAIGEPRYGQCNFSYLIIGSARALLFDTGPGVRNIAPIVRQLTSLPVEALPSHLHFDHTGNLARFADVALPDLPALRPAIRRQAGPFTGIE